MSEREVPAGDASINCPDHPERAAVASCASCGRLICAQCRLRDLEGLAICPGCAAVAAVPDPLRELAAAALTSGEPLLVAPEERRPTFTAIRMDPLPWERADRFGDLEAFLRTVITAFTRPLRYMARIQWDRGELRTPLLFALVCAVLGNLSLILQMVLAPERIPLPPDGPIAQMHLPPMALALIAAPALPLILSALLFAEAGIAHWLIGLVSTHRRPFEATFRVFAYAEVASLLLWVPRVGHYLENFFFVFLVLTGVRLAHRSGFQAGVMALLPVMLIHGLWQ